MQAFCLKLVVLFTLLVSALMPVGAFFPFFKKKKQQVIEPLHINEEFLVQKNTEVDGVLYPIRFAVYIPRNNEFIKLSALYDELSQEPITNVTWITEAKNKKSKAPVVIKAIKTETQILEKMEQLALAYDPSSAYDRITEDKHVINKSFFFNRAEVFGEINRPIAHFVELEIGGNTKQQFRIDDEIYLKPAPIITPQTAGKNTEKKRSTPSPNFGDIKPPSYLRPQESSQELNPEQMRDLQEFEDAKRKIHETNLGQEDPEDLRKQMTEMQMMLDESMGGEGEEDSPLF